MNKYINLASISMLIVLLLNCGKDTWERDLKKIDPSSLYSNNAKDWSLVEVWKNEWNTDYTIKKVDNDTVKILFYLKGNNDSIYVNGYREQFPCGSGDTCYIEWDSADTLFFYREKGGIKSFVVGEYMYRMLNGLLNNTELDFYNSHEDSLRKVRGSNLPKLPYQK